MLTTLVVVLVAMALMAVGAGVLLGVALYLAIMVALFGLLVVLSLFHLIIRWRGGESSPSAGHDDAASATGEPT